MTDIQIHPLSEKPEFASTCAAWSFSEWGCHLPNRTIENGIERYKERAKNTDKVPLTWIATKDDFLVGTVSLVECDHEERKDLTPWISSMFVHREFRGNGYATQLIKRVQNDAKNIGYETLYLYTPDAMELYEKLGWEVIGQVSDSRGFYEHETLMEINL